VRIDVNAFLGHYPYRRVVGGSPMGLLEAMDRTGIDQAWISNLASVFWRDPTEGNAVVYGAASGQPRLRPVPAVHPSLANWPQVLREAIDRGAPCVRADPCFYGIDPIGGEMQTLLFGCGEQGIPLLMAVRLEDGRQRHANDTALDLSPAAIRALIRMEDRVRLIITHADRECVEQVHFGSTPAEAARILWDISWIWGPPEDHLDQLVTALGPERLCFGTGMPLRLPETSVAKLDLAVISGAARTAIESGNIAGWVG
jgi:hypothetical protein